MATTHTVFNQAKALSNYNTFESDGLLVSLIERYGADWAKDRFEVFDSVTGSADAINLANDANTNPPVLKTHSRFDGYSPPMLR